jgi:hypothetical protein
MLIQEILSLEINNQDFPDGMTIRDFLKDLLEALWTEAECFSGKRPFGNSDWQYMVYIPLIKAGVVKGVIDEDGYIERFDEEEKADKIIIDCINSF